MKFETGQLVRHRTTRDIGIVKDVDADYYGATQPYFKTSEKVLEITTGD